MRSALELSTISSPSNDQLSQRDDALWTSDYKIVTSLLPFFAVVGLTQGH